MMSEQARVPLCPLSTEVCLYHLFLTYMSIISGGATVRIIPSIHWSGEPGVAIESFFRLHFDLIDSYYRYLMFTQAFFATKAFESNNVA